jgi:hypothetical protein
MVPRLIITGVVVLLVGCATGPQVDDLSTMKPDCTNAAFQVKSLERELAYRKYDPNGSDFERRYINNAKNIIWTLRSTCLQRIH